MRKNAVATSMWPLMAVLALASIQAIPAHADRFSSMGQLSLNVCAMDSGTQHPVSFTDFRVVNSDDASRVYTARTDAWGTFTINVPPGNYRIESVQPVYFQGRSLTWDSPVKIESSQLRNIKLTDYDAESYNINAAIVPSRWSIAEGRPIRLELMDALRSNRSHEGDTVHYRVADNVYGPNHELLIEAGAPAFGTVTRAYGSGTLGRNGKLDFTADSARAVDGTTIPLRGDEVRKGSHNLPLVVGGVVLFGVGGGFIKGENVSVPPGSIFTAYVDQDCDINVPAR